MKRRLLNQMATEWRSNVWLVTELVIVLVVIEFLFGLLCQIYDWQNAYRGYDLNDTFVLEIADIDDDSPDYVQGSEKHAVRKDRSNLIAALKNNPYVDIVGPLGTNAQPYSMSYWGGSIFMESDADTVVALAVNKRFLSGDAIRAMRIEGLNGETPDELAEVLERGEIIVCPPDKDYASDPSLDYSAALNKEIDNYGQSFRVGALGHGIRRSDYEPLSSGVAYFPIDKPPFSSIIVRTKEGRGDDFLKSMSAERLRAGNSEISEINNINDMRRKANLKVDQLRRNVVVCSLFLLLVILLGFLGTFWFRTGQRTAEIAIRKVNGATDGDVFRRLIAEGLVLVAVATLIASTVLYFLNPVEMYRDLLDREVTPTSVVYGAVIAIVVIVVLVIIGIWAPARRATRIDPAYALADQ